MTEFVSRAGAKLQYALDYFGISVANLICADFGSSTGGFVDCLLQNGASKVYSVDTAYGELAWKLRTNPKVTVMERENAMHVKLPEQCDFISIDVSLTRQKFVLPNACENLKPNGIIITLIKPHYESQSHELVKGKVSELFVETILTRVLEDIKKLEGVTVKEYIESPIRGERGGNREFLVFISKS